MDYRIIKGRRRITIVPLSSKFQAWVYANIEGYHDGGQFLRDADLEEAMIEEFTVAGFEGE